MSKMTVTSKMGIKVAVKAANELEMCAAIMALAPFWPSDKSVAGGAK